MCVRVRVYVETYVYFLMQTLPGSHNFFPYCSNHFKKIIISVAEARYIAGMRYAESNKANYIERSFPSISLFVKRIYSVKHTRTAPETAIPRFVVSSSRPISNLLEAPHPTSRVSFLGHHPICAIIVSCENRVRDSVWQMWPIIICHKCDRGHTFSG